MWDRIKICFCHPRWIGKFHHDHPGIVAGTILLFFALFLTIYGVRCYTTSPFDQAAGNTVAAALVNHGAVNASYKNKELTGEQCTITGDNFHIYILKAHDTQKLNITNISICLEEKQAVVYLGNLKMKTVSYQSISSEDFDFKDISTNQPKAIYQFKIFINEILNSSRVPFQTMDFIQGIFNEIIFYFLLVVLLSFYALAINPTIDKNIRIKLCMYDALSYFIVSFFAELFNLYWLNYLALVLPIIYCTITFRHIVKVVIKKD